MRITLITVGKIKEKFYRDAVEEYTRRLSRYCKLDIVEVADEKTPDNASEAENQKILSREGDRILSRIRDNTYVITLAIKGQMLDSVELSKQLDMLSVSGKSDITFIIGGSLGLDSRVDKRADFALSFSRMTFPHQLMRVILLEQIYRAFRISANEPYHK
ncbi:MAG: 23S rRNA (pseudouridine(1915)-N(3))-methyltransferase RlmH [Thermoflexaceae bacterium]|nr:23S rRNA (pseudouridine(1915)-N(3))-methyltransferase RlmH [Thermoflexaceae bacterium]